jgi:hypothetical protein
MTVGNFGREVGCYQDLALTQPGIITRNVRDRTVMISVTMKGNRAKQRHHHLRTYYAQARFGMLGAADRPPQPSATPNARL